MGPVNSTQKLTVTFLLQIFIGIGYILVVKSELYVSPMSCIE